MGAEAELVTRCRRGEPGAWDELFDQHYPAAARFILQLGSDFTREDAEEICQEVFLSIIQHIDSFHGGCQLRTWIFRIAANKARDYRERQHAAKRGGGLATISLQAEDPERDIQLYINSPGGSITAGFAIYDTMQFVKPDVVTTCVGQAASIAAVLLAGGAPKKRFALPNARILIHQPWMSGLGGQATDIDLHAKEILRMRLTINTLLAKHSGQPVERIEKDVERDYIMNPEQAKEYGMIDEIIYKHR